MPATIRKTGSNRDPSLRPTSSRVSPITASADDRRADSCRARRQARRDRARNPCEARSSGSLSDFSPMKRSGAIQRLYRPSRIAAWMWSALSAAPPSARTLQSPWQQHPSSRRESARVRFAAPALRAATFRQLSWQSGSKAVAGQAGPRHRESAAADAAEAPQLGPDRAKLLQFRPIVPLRAARDHTGWSWARRGVLYNLVGQ